jgi:hypothetical protein
VDDFAARLARTLLGGISVAGESPGPTR